MKRVLFLAHAFPPACTPGATRAAGLSAHLGTHGWSSTVVTATPGARSQDRHNSVRVVGQTDLTPPLDLMNGLLDRMLRLGGRELEFNVVRDLLVPDVHVTWPAGRAARRLARDSDVILATCGPFSAGMKAVAAGKRSGRPVVLDFRDAWSQNAHTRHTAWHWRRIRRAERRLLGAATRVVFNTPGALALYNRLYPAEASKFRCVPNGYDALNLPEAGEASGDGVFRIVHTGSLYGKRTADTLLRALSALNDPRLHFVQVGPCPGDLARRHPRASVEVLPSVSREESLRWMRRASALYLTQGRGTDDGPDIAVAAKTYEYLATGVPVLVEAPEGDNLAMVRRYAPRHAVVSSGNVDEMCAALESLRRMDPTPRIDAEFEARYSRSALTATFAAVLDECLAGENR